MEKQVCLLQQASKQTTGKNHSDFPHPDACFIWRRFAKYVKSTSHYTKCYKVYNNYFKLLSILTISLNLIFINYSLFESSQTLFWASFGLIDLENFELTGH
jgi:hypothetical protein